MNFNANWMTTITDYLTGRWILRIYGCCILKLTEVWMDISLKKHWLANSKIIYKWHLQFRLGKTGSLGPSMEGSFWQKHSLLQQTMTLLQGPKDPVLPTLISTLPKSLQVGSSQDIPRIWALFGWQVFFGQRNKTIGNHDFKIV